MAKMKLTCHFIIFKMATSLAIDELFELDSGRYFTIYTNIFDMLKSRGFVSLQKQKTFAEYNSEHIGNLATIEENRDPYVFIDSMVLYFQNGSNKLLVYFFPFNSKMRQNDLAYINKLKDSQKCEQFIIVSKINATPQVMNTIRLFGANAQLFQESELMFNITKHVLVPKHDKLIGDERNKVLSQFCMGVDGEIHLERLPAIFTTDPVCKYYNWQVNDLVEIKRPRSDGFHDLTFRLVVEPTS